MEVILNGVLYGMLLAFLIAGTGLLLPGGRAWAQGVDPANRPIAEVRIQGLEQVSEQLVRNQIRSVAGVPYHPPTVEQDIVRLTHLGRFSEVRAQVPTADPRR